MKKKSAIPDDLLYKNFTLGCPYTTNGKHIKAINAAVRCRDDRAGWPAHCPNCGWNPDCKKRRLADKYGMRVALKCMAVSDELAIKTKKEINEGKYAYV